MKQKTNIGNRMRLFPLVVYCVMLLSSCYNHVNDKSDIWNMTGNQIDSISFSATHHYAKNFNFIVTGDSICLQRQAPDEVYFDSITILKGDRIVVADIMTIPSDTVDSIWIKLARDQATQGWVHEKQLLTNVSPDDPISNFIDVFSDIHLLLFLAMVIIAGAFYGIYLLRRKNAYIVHFNDIDSIYPTLLTMTVSLSATIYAAIQLFASESWRHFYFHPSLNPFTQPLHLGIFITILWAMVIVLLATIEDVIKQLPIPQAFLYLCGLAAICAIDYIIFSILTLYYIGFFILIAYFYYAVNGYVRHYSSSMICGNCGAKLAKKGICPKCGVNNV